MESIGIFHFFGWLFCERYKPEPSLHFQIFSILAISRKTTHHKTVKKLDIQLP